MYELTQGGVVALMVAIFAGMLALLVAGWQPTHDCGNRYCRHVRPRAGDDDTLDWRR